MKKRNGQSSFLRVFYYSHPYLVIFNALIIYNLVLIALAAWLMTWLMRDVIDQASGEALGYSISAYLKNLEYCTVFTMNTGGIYDNAPDSVVILKIILSVVQMITFTGSLVGLATSMLQGVFDRRAHNVGRLKLKNHYVILNWSPAAANLIRELSFLSGRKTVVVLSSESRDEINEQIDNIFLETGTDRKNITVFVKQGKPSSRKALKEISIDKAKSIALLVPSDSVGHTNASDVDTFKLLMGIIGITKEASIAIEAVDEDTVKSMEDLIKASSDLRDLELTIFSKGSVVGHILAKSAINSSFADLYYSMLTYKNGSFYEIKTNTTVEESMKYYNDCIPVSRYKDGDEEMTYALASGPTKVFKRLVPKSYNKEVPFQKKLYYNSFVLFVIGQNNRSESILEEAKAYTESKLGKIDCKVYPFDYDINQLLDEINSTKRRKKILILSDEDVDSDNVDVNVFMTLLNLKASHKLSSDVEISAELLDQSNRSSLASLNVTNVIISNQMVALYLVQLMTHPRNTKFYEGLLSSKTDYKASSLDIDVRYAEEVFNLENPLEFTSRGEFIQAVYKSSNHEYLPIGFVGEKQKKGTLGTVTGAITTVVGKTIGGAMDIAKKTIGTITDMGAALNMDEIGQVEAQIDVNSRIQILSDHLSKKEKITINKGMIIIFIHYPSN